MSSNNSELTKSRFHEFLQAKMASFSKFLLAKVLFLQAKMASFSKLLLAKVLYLQDSGQQTTAGVKPWFNFILGLEENYFPLFYTSHYQTLPYTKTKENKNWTKDKIEPQHRQK